MLPNSSGSASTAAVESGSAVLCKVHQLGVLPRVGVRVSVSVRVRVRVRVRVWFGS